MVAIVEARVTSVSDALDVGPSMVYQGERMKRTILRQRLGALGLLVAFCAISCADRVAATDAGLPAASATADATEGKPAPPEASTAPKGAPSAAESSAAVAAPPEASASAVPAAKQFACGAKEKPCPMQGWMKRVMAPAASAGEGPALASALTYVAKHVPPGFDTWAAISNEGVKKAKAGDVDGAKASCKQCHDAYKAQYKATMRDRPF